MGEYMGQSEFKFNSSTCLSLLLWSAVLLWLLPSLRLRLMLIPPSSTELTAMLVSPMPDTAMVVSGMLAMLDMVPTPMPTERGLLMPSPRLMPTTAMLVLVMVPMVLAMLDMLLPMPMVPTTERGLLMLSPRLMPTTAMLVLVMVPMVLAMLDMLLPMPTPTPTVSTASKMSSQPQIRVAHQVQTEAQKQTKSR